MKRSQKKGFPGRDKHPGGVQIPKAVLDEAIDVVCQECEADVFIQGSRIKRISAIMSPDGKEKYVWSAVAVCVKCNAVLPDNA